MKIFSLLIFFSASLLQAGYVIDETNSVNVCHWKKIEKEMGRVKNVNKFSDRLIDLDLLTFNDEISEGKITLPHKDILKYSFVLVPFAEIYPEFVHPVNQKSIEKLLKEKNSFLSEVEKIN